MFYNYIFKRINSLIDFPINLVEFVSFQIVFAFLYDGVEACKLHESARLQDVLLLNCLYILQLVECPPLVTYPLQILIL